MVGIAALCAAYVLSQLYRSFLAVLAPALVADLSMSYAQLSLASGIWFGAFALAQFAVGVSLDRFGPRRTAGLYLAFGGGGALVFAAAQGPAMVILAMALIGFGCAPALMASYVLFARNFDAARFALLASAFIGFGNLGNVLAAAPLAAAAESMGWRPVLLVLSATTLAVSVAILMLVRDPARVDHDGDDGGFAGYLMVLRIRALWPIIPMVMVYYACAGGVRGLWAGPLLADLHGADALLIGRVTLAMALAMTIGSFVYGPLDTLFNTRKWIIVGGGAIMVVALMILTIRPDGNLWTVTLALMMIGAAGVGYGVIAAHAKSFVPTAFLGRGVTLINFFSIGGAALMQLASGGVLTASLDPADPVGGYRMLFGFYALAVAVPLAIYLFSRDARPNG